MDTISNADLANITGGSFLSDTGDTLANSAFGAGVGAGARALFAYATSARTPHLSYGQTRGLAAASGAKWGAIIAGGATVATKAYNAAFGSK